jgi:hypothetical protein
VPLSPEVDVTNLYTNYKLTKSGVCSFLEKFRPSKIMVQNFTEMILVEIGWVHVWKKIDWPYV